MESEDSLFIIMTSGPAAPTRCAAPFYMANLAAVMEQGATIVFQMEGVLLMKKGVAEHLTSAEGGKPVLEFIRDAHQAGVQMYCCSAAMKAQGMSETDLISECHGAVGGAWIVSEASAAGTVFSY